MRAGCVRARTAGCRSSPSTSRRGRSQSGSSPSAPRWDGCWPPAWRPTFLRSSPLPSTSSQVRNKFLFFSLYVSDLIIIFIIFIIIVDTGSVLADWCIIDMVDENGLFQRTASPQAPTHLWQLHAIPPSAIGSGPSPFFSLPFPFGSIYLGLLLFVLFRAAESEEYYRVVELGNGEQVGIECGLTAPPADNFAMYLLQGRERVFGTWLFGRAQSPYQVRIPHIFPDIWFVVALSNTAHARTRTRTRMRAEGGQGGVRGVGATGEHGDRQRAAVPGDRHGSSGQGPFPRHPFSRAAHAAHSRATIGRIPPW
jgi:hypothetical protein